MSALGSLLSNERANDRHPDCSHESTDTDLRASEVLVLGDAQERDLSRE